MASFDQQPSSHGQSGHERWLVIGAVVAAVAIVVALVVVYGGVGSSTGY